MTHLDDVVREQWLQELHRITAPTGLVLLTISGEHTTSRAGFSTNTFAEYLRTGHMFYRSPEAIDDILGRTGYYGTAYVTHDHVRRTWARWFHVDQIISGCIGNYQDLVVLRPR